MHACTYQGLSAEHLHSIRFARFMLATMSAIGFATSNPILILAHLFARIWSSCSRPDWCYPSV
jgi:hypothetical protein